MSSTEAHVTALAPRAGAVVGGYRLEHVLGEGGMGVVWAARSSRGEPVALKLLGADAVGASDRARLLREAWAARAIVHPNVVRVLDILELDGGVPALVMERLEGESLAARLSRAHALSLDETLGVLRPLLAAVGAAHAVGVIHRDLKPANVFLARGEDGAITVKVLDFGVAKLTSIDAAETSLTTTGTILGTPRYMAPEQIFGDRDLDQRVDIWALGLIVYECLTGVLPTRGENVGQVLKIILTRPIPPIVEIAPDVPPGLAALVNRMLARERDARPRTIAEIEDALARHESAPPDAGSAPTRAGAPERGGAVHSTAASATGGRARARPWVLLAVGAAIVLGGVIASMVLAGVFATTYGSRGHGRPAPPPGACGTAVACTWTDLPDRARVEPAEILPRIRKMALDVDGSATLITIGVASARDGVVDLTAQENIVFIFATTDEALNVVVQENLTSVHRGYKPLGAFGVPDPRCSLKAAWKAAGIPAGTPAGATYSGTPLDGPMWILGDSRHGYVVNAMTCARKYQ